ncbi:MAG: flagellar basal body rod protein FlgB [Armatimonadota bacterium]
MLDYLTDTTTLSLAKSLDGIAARHKVIANNIANAETPGFVRSDVTFEDSLKQAMESGSDDDIRKSLEDIQPQTVADETTAAGPNGNNVSIDKEMADLTKNSLNYESVIQILNMKSTMIKSAITEGRR